MHTGHTTESSASPSVNGPARRWHSHKPTRHEQRPTGGTCCVSHSPRAFLLLAKVALVIILQVCKHLLLWACSRHETTALHNKRLTTLPTCSFQVNSQLVFHCSHQVKVLLAREQA